MSLLDAVSTGTNFLSAGSSALGLVSSTKALFGKKTIHGIQDFLFDIPQNDELTLTAQITDHYIETNAAAQDHIAVEPTRIRLTGQMGELVYTRDQAEAYISEVLNRLGPLGVLGAAGSSKTREYLSQYNRTKQAVTNAIKMAAKLGVPGAEGLFGVTAEGKQQQAYQTLKNWFDSRSMVQSDPTKPGKSLLTVETPWDTLTNMAIESIVFSQDESSKDFSTVEVSLKQIRFVEVAVKTGTLDQRSLGGPVKEKGISPGVETTPTTIYGKLTGQTVAQ